jgi:hypothetical protein
MQATKTHRATVGLPSNSLKKEVIEPTRLAQDRILMDKISLKLAVLSVQSVPETLSRKVLHILKVIKLLKHAQNY